ncbi:hypothetical protein BC834DRAFT_356548 [Gloeopeniophorella convolvens]|nr:hypothetical protein BC834DRAFT_356548 [Gloeopeniophorella convolvens]
MAPRPGQFLNLAAILDSQNPSIDLHLSTYDASTKNFSKAITDFNNRAVAEITQRREAHAADRKKLAERAQSIEKETNQCKLREIELIGVLEREREETKEAESSVSALRRQVVAQKEALAALDAEIEQYRARVGSLRRERERERLTLEQHMAPLAAEARACERALGCVIEGVGPDQLLIRFSIKVGEGDGSKQDASFVLDVSLQSYRVLTSTPLLPTLPILLDQLNESRDVFTFIKQMRQAFAELFA